jgi:DeoR family transcriptional regulator, suf operon transcriptional repressor
MSTRDQVLKSLLAHPRITINELAEQVGINPISIRHHISSLEADGLVSSEEERHGVGRPRRVYFLSEAGIERFPTHYVRLTVRLLEQLKETMPKAMLNKIFTQMAQDMAQDISSSTNLSTLSMEDRLNATRELLKREGFNMEWEQSGDTYQIHEINCPYFHIGQSHPEVCVVDQNLISAFLSVPASKIRCILNGDVACTYVIDKPN